MTLAQVIFRMVHSEENVLFSSAKRKQPQDEDETTASSTITTKETGSSCSIASSRAASCSSLLSSSPVRRTPSTLSSCCSSELREVCFPCDLDLNKEFAGSTFLDGTNSRTNNEENLFSVKELQEISKQARPGLLELTVSRTGRELQRWSTVTVEGQGDSSSITNNCRLTTGTVPILQDGRILLISSAKSPGVFVLPKGGWESDETMPLSALRETLEEAGVTGLLGPPLPAITYETKKAALRRNKQGQGHNQDDVTNDETKSSKIVKHTHNRMTIFPLYVQYVYDNWPEQTRLRRAVSLEEALVLVEHRPEFRHILLTLQERGLHRIGKTIERNNI